MAAAALLRSMARKLARAPPVPPRPLLAAGLHGGARSCPGASLPPPLSSNQIRQVGGERLVGGMAATAGLRSGAALPSFATKIARAPSQLHHRHILNRGLHSNTAAPPTGDKDKIIEDLRRQLWHAKTAVSIGGVAVLGFAVYWKFWLLPGLEKMRDRSVAFQRLERELRDIIIRADEDKHRSVALAQIIQTAGQMKQQSNGTSEKGTRDKSQEEDVMAVYFDILKEAAAGLEEMRADLKESGAATARMSKSAPLEQKEGCSLVGSEAVSS